MEVLPKFNEIKTVEAATYLLNKAGGKMRYIMLLKLLYMSDRKAIEEWGKPITYDNYVSMDYGQVLSKTYNLIKGEIKSDSGMWEEFIESPIYLYWIVLRKAPPKIRKLSRGEIEFLDEIYKEYKDKDPFTFTHNLPEYVDPKGSSIPMPFERLLEILNYDQKDIEAILSDLEEKAIIEAAFET